MSRSQHIVSAITIERPWISRLRRSLLGWYARQARDLPWRRTRDPYAIWVSEVMLQQTQVAAVVPYFGRFLAAFPTVEALAAAPEADVLHLWEGLGYYRRALHLHRAAQKVVRDHAGRIPDDPAQLRSLPGVGRYTAGAILSIAFDRREPILEANSRRVVARLVALKPAAGRTAPDRLLWLVAEQLLPQRDAGRFNQALMELGATVCRPASPLCGVCPLRGLCKARQQGIEHTIPGRPSKPPRKQVREAAVIVRRGSRVLLLRRPHAGRWAGLHDFPRFPIPPHDGRPLQHALAKAIKAQTGLRVRIGRKLAEIRHGLMHYSITLDCYEARCSPTSKPSNHVAQTAKPGGRQDVRTLWVSLSQLAALPMSSPARRLSRIIAQL